jgi:hypothetical protein
MDSYGLIYQTRDTQYRMDLTRVTKILPKPREDHRSPIFPKIIVEKRNSSNSWHSQ